MTDDEINSYRCTVALRTLEEAGVIGHAFLVSQQLTTPEGTGVCIGVSDEDSGLGSERYWRIYIPDCEGIEVFGPEDYGRMTINLSDPATVASLIVQVREAWGLPGAYFRGGWVYNDNGGSPEDDDEISGENGMSEAEAFVDALEAKAREVLVLAGSSGAPVFLLTNPPRDPRNVDFVSESDGPPEAPINCSYCMDSGIDPDNGLECAMPAHDPVIVQEGETVQCVRLIPVLPEGEVTLPPEIIGVGLYSPHGVSRMFVRGGEE